MDNRIDKTIDEANRILDKRARPGMVCLNCGTQLQSEQASCLCDRQTEHDALVELQEELVNKYAENPTERDRTLIAVCEAAILATEPPLKKAPDLKSYYSEEFLKTGAQEHKRSIQDSSESPIVEPGDGRPNPAANGSRGLGDTKTDSGSLDTGGVGVIDLAASSRFAVLLEPRNRAYLLDAVLRHCEAAAIYLRAANEVVEAMPEDERPTFKIHWALTDCEKAVVQVRRAQEFVKKLEGK